MVRKLEECRNWAPNSISLSNHILGEEYAKDSAVHNIHTKGNSLCNLRAKQAPSSSFRSISLLLSVSLPSSFLPPYYYFIFFSSPFPNPLLPFPFLPHPFLPFYFSSLASLLLSFSSIYPSIMLLLPSEQLSHHSVYSTNL